MKNKTRVWKPARFKELITTHSQLYFVELKDENKARWSATRSGFCSCAAICNEHKAKADVVEWWFNIAIPWFPLLVD